MRTVKDVEAYLEKLNRQLTPVENEEGTFLLQSSDGPAIAIRVEPPLVVLRVYIGELPPPASVVGHAPVFRKLLELNARALIHTSYGLEDNRIVLSSALELENLDFNELEAVMDEMDLALAQQVPELAELSKNA